MTIEDSTGRRMNVIDVVVRALVPVLFALVGWFGSTVIDHSERLAVIEANRWTREDATKNREDLKREIQSVKDALPHKLFYDRVDEMAVLLKSIDGRLHSIEAQGQKR